METATAVHIPYLDGFDSIGDISRVLDGYGRRDIKYAPWANGTMQPQASFALAYSADAIYLKYYVSEYALKAQYTHFNDPVFEDSCVEFFIAFDDDESYYNLEFNCMGTSRGQYGPHKLGRTFIPASLFKNY